MYTKTSGTEERIDERTRRAATESMTVVSNGKGRFDVYSGEKGRYKVNLVFGTCDCPAATYQAGACKHVRRVEMEMGLREIPDLGRRTDVEIMTGADDDETEQVVIADGGTVVEHIQETDDGRPEDCDCLSTFDELPCWPCYRDGFRMPNPNATEEEDR